MIPNMLRTFITFLCLSFVICAALDKHEEKKARILKEKTLSGEAHFTGDEHNPDFDHEAFLGDDAKEFDQMTPSESQSKLGQIVDKIDTDEDGYVTQEELKAWIDHTQKKYILDDVRRQWSSHNPKNKDKIQWEEYKSIVYGFMDDMDSKDMENDQEEGGYLDMLRRDKRRWEYADEDKDEFLTLDEFTNFLHPEESSHMKDLVITETMEDIDSDKDGKISIQEYIGDMYKGNEGEDEPSWVENEREQFDNFRDKNKDGFMTMDEVRNWIIPSDYDHSEAEAKHLISESDIDGDKQLTKKEILDKYDLFVGSQATDFGEALVNHDEF